MCPQLAQTAIASLMVSNEHVVLRLPLITSTRMAGGQLLRRRPLPLQTVRARTQLAGNTITIRLRRTNQRLYLRMVGLRRGARALNAASSDAWAANDD